MHDTVLQTIRYHWPVWLSCALLLPASSCHQRGSGRVEIAVAAAANLTEACEKLGPRFEALTGIHPVFSYGGTSQLTQQIENQAPYDLIAAADAEHVDQLEREGLLVSGSNAPYAVGVLALWVPPSSKAPVHRLEDVAGADVHTIAAAKPELAPYGKATVESLLHAGIWDRVKDRVAYADNINMARQYGSSGNADVVFTAYSLVLHELGTVIQVEGGLHSPIVQKLGILSSSRHREEARKFAAFLISGEGRAILGGFGYGNP